MQWPKFRYLPAADSRIGGPADRRAKTILNSERCRLLPGHTCQLMQLAVEGLQVPDVRDAEEEDVAAFNNFLDKAYRLWLAKPHRGLQRHRHCDRLVTVSLVLCG